MSGAQKIAISAAIGGTAEALGGGKFANGAVTGAYVMALNHMGHLIGERHRTGKSAFGSARARTRQPGSKETPFFFVKDVETNEYYFYVMDPSEYDATTEICKFELYPDGNGNLYLDQELTQAVKAHYHTSYTSEWAAPTGSTKDYNTSKLYNGIPVFHMNTEKFNVWEYRWSSDPSFDYIGKPHDRREMPQF